MEEKHLRKEQKRNQKEKEIFFVLMERNKSYL